MKTFLNIAAELELTNWRLLIVGSAGSNDVESTWPQANC